jgi:hypothetical protein
MLRLKPGDRWRRAGVTCAVAPAKRMVKCLNGGGDGFLIGPNAYKLLSSR